LWFWFALGSAVFAALTSILAKVGIEGVNSNLATAIRTMVVVAMAWGMVFLTNAQKGIADISRRSRIFLILSGWQQVRHGCVITKRSCESGTSTLRSRS
jgi:transporter family protein